MQPGGHQSLTNFQLLSSWGIVAADRPALEMHADRGLAKVAAEFFPRPAIICAAQRLSAILHGKLIGFLDQGRIIETARHNELVRRGSVYQNLYKLQFSS